MLVSEVDFEVMDGLAETHEAKGARFDHTGMDWADRNLVHFLSVDLEERVTLHFLGAAPFKADRLEPRVPGDAHAALLVKLPLEAVDRRDVGGQRVIASRRIESRPQHLQPAAFRLDHRSN